MNDFFLKILVGFKNIFNYSGGFPGCQPVSMIQENLCFLKDKPYKVSWKADGTRYMMLIGMFHILSFLSRLFFMH